MANTAGRLPEFEAEINDLLLVTQAVAAVRTHCETLKSTALSQEWLPSTAVPGSMTDGLYGIRFAIPGPDSPCNCFSLAALHLRQMSELTCTEECGDTVFQLQDAALLLRSGGVQLLWQVWI